MNAMLRRKDVVAVISNDATRARLSHLHEGLDQVRASQSALGSDLARFGDKLEALKETLLARFDKQGEQINALCKRVDLVYVSVRVVVAILGLCVSAAVIANGLKALGWT